VFPNLRDARKKMPSRKLPRKR